MKVSKILIIGIIITSVFTYDLILNVTKPMSFEDAYYIEYSVDYALHLLIVKNTITSLLSGNFEQVLTLPIFYGVKNSIAFSDAFFIQTLLYFPVYFISKNIIFSYNLTVILNFLLSFLSMFCLSYYFTKNYFASTLASTIYTFNPFIMARYPTAIEIHSTLWIPLIFLFIEKSLKNPTAKNVFFFFLFLTCQLLSSLYYSAFLSIILPLYISVRVIQQKFNPIRFLNAGFLPGFLMFATFAIGLGSIYFNFYSKEPIDRDINASSYFSAKPFEYLTQQPPRNFLYTHLRNLTGIPGVKTNFEHHLFAGYSVLLFLLVGSIICFRKRQINRLLGLFIIFTLLSFILSLGPKTPFYNLFYFVDPLLSFIRAPARFATFVFFFLSLGLALIWIKLFSGKSLKEKVVFLILILVIILEYFNLPTNFSDIPDQTEQFYQYIDSRPDIKVMVELPLGLEVAQIDDYANISYFDGPYLLYAASLHSKKLINGYSGYIPKEYTQKIKLFNTGVLNKQKLVQVKDWGVDAIVLHKNIFRSLKDFEIVRAALISLGVSEIKKTEDLYLFDLTGWKTN